MKNLRIGLQLMIGFTTVLILVVVLGVTAYIQTNRIHDQNEFLLRHPFQVQAAIGDFRVNILAIHRAMKDLVIAHDEREISEYLAQIDLWKAEAFTNIDILHERYLGNLAEIDSIHQNFITWNTMREETIRLIRLGQIEQAGERTKKSGIAGQQVEKILSYVSLVDTFSSNKAKSLNIESNSLNRRLNERLLIIVMITLFTSLLFYLLLVLLIRKPLVDIKKAAIRFNAGDLDSRSDYRSKNELGTLAETFNKLAEATQNNINLNKKASELSSLMIREEEAKQFFTGILNKLAKFADAQMAAIYLLDEQSDKFVHYLSIGLGEKARESFDASNFEGEFGPALASGNIQHITNIPESTRFLFHTSAQTVLPREIMTIPLIFAGKTNAMISMASITKFDDHIPQIIESVYETLCIRVNGVLANHQVRELSAALEQQNLEIKKHADIIHEANQELMAQKEKLSIQSSELMEQNTELEIQKKQLSEANRLKTNFLSNMSHELRTPLNSVIALSGVLGRRLQGIIPEEEYSYLEVIERNGRHLLSLINDILDLSRIEAGKEEVNTVAFSANSLIGEIIELIRPQALQKGLTMTHLDSEADIILNSDPAKCRHILINLIGNAVKFTNEGNVEVTAKTLMDEIIIKVLDTGIGIDPENITHIFDEFRQADSSTSRRFGGTGLGLTIAKKYALLLGGNIFVNSTPEEGSVFTLVLPLNYTRQNQADTVKHTMHYNNNTMPENVQDALLNKTILIVEDSKSAIIQLYDILQETSCRVLEASDGKSALDLVDQTLPDAIILDLMMPELDGFDVLKALRKNPKTRKVPVLILTAKHISKEELSFLEGNGIHQLIQKGDINRGALLHAVISMVNKYDQVAHTANLETPKSPKMRITGKPLVLIVEDNPDNMLTAKALLSDTFRIIEAVNGHEAVEIAKKQIPHLILMDIALPGIDGIKAFTQIRKDTRLQHTHIIALTASAMTSEREAILAHGFDAYIAKPIDALEFFKTINEVLYGA